MRDSGNDGRMFRYALLQVYVCWPWGGGRATLHARFGQRWTYIYTYFEVCALVPVYVCWP